MSQVDLAFLEHADTRQALNHLILLLGGHKIMHPGSDLARLLFHDLRQSASRRTWEYFSGIRKPTKEVMDESSPSTLDYLILFKT